MSGGFARPSKKLQYYTSEIRSPPVLRPVAILYAVLNACSAIERFGFPVSYLPIDKWGVFSPESLTEMLSKNTKPVSVMLANNEIVTIKPIAELAELEHRQGALFHTDAVQAVGHIPVDVKALGVDMLKNEERFVILTTQTNDFMWHVHDWMPLVPKQNQIED